MYRLHSSPDTTAVIVRLALEEAGAPYETHLIDRAAGELDTPAYRAIAPTGLIPVLETPDGPIFETGAILLWLADSHGGLAPAQGAAGRAGFLKWLFYLSNTPHADLQRLFRPARFAGPDPAQQGAFAQRTSARLVRHYTLLDGLPESEFPGPSLALSLYLAMLLRWSALYPVGGTTWFDIAAWPRLHDLCRDLETRPAVRRVAMAEGLGDAPFSAPGRPRDVTTD